MILQTLFFTFQNRKLLFSKKASMEVQTIVMLALIFFFAIIIVYYVVKGNTANENMVDVFGMLRGASYD